MNINQNCVCRKYWRRFKLFDFKFLQFWHNYFRSTGQSVKSMPIKYFISARELVKLIEISKCKCDDLIERLQPEGKRYAPKELEIPSKMECVFCGKNYLNESTLVLHMEIHLGHHCIACNKTYRSFDMERHFQTRKHLKNVAQNCKSG